MTITRAFAADRDTVWRCYSEANLLDQWIAPAPYTAETERLDFSDGGHWVFAMTSPESDRHYSRFDYEALNPVDGFRARTGFCDQSGAINEAMPRPTWDVSFTETSDGALSKIVITYASVDEMDQMIQMGMKDGLVLCIEQMATVIVRLAASA